MYKIKRSILTASMIAIVALLVCSGAASALAQSGANRDLLARSFASIAKKVEPSVVSIETKGKLPTTVASGNTTPGDSEDILDFFRRQQTRRPSFSVGSGFIVDKSGYIVTNAHVIENASRITVKLESGEEFVAKIVGADEETDIAVLKIEAGRDLPALVFGDPDKAEVGDWVLAIGSPFGLAKSVTAGIISQKKRETPGTTAFQKFIQTDAAINRGNSGGPLVNLDGEVIGVNSQIATTNGDSNGVGFALPADETERVYGQILKFGKVKRGYLGVLLDSVKAEFAKIYGLGDTRGAIITDLRDKQSAAALAGLQVGDVIVEFNKQKVEGAQDLIAKVASTAPDSAIDLVYIREAGSGIERKTITIRLAERPTVARTTADDEGGRKLPIDGVKPPEKPFGLTLADLTPTLAATYKLEGQKGLLVKEVNPASYIADIRTTIGEPVLGEGDLIQRINRVSVTDTKSFGEIVARLKAGDPVVLHVISYDPRSRAPQFKIVQFTVR
ncbi:MAG: trypsin-like peptidase domain-containing protein [Pyrinomonadaceae bacterium]|nr:trypsin-like peptidase domain-containing protein [Pyrinomonadaceae bacterium]